MPTSRLLLPILNFQALLRMSYAYLKKKNPLKEMYFGILSYLSNMLTANKRLKVVQHRVNHLNFRVNQMEKLIDENNQYNHSNGRILNQLR